MKEDVQTLDESVKEAEELNADLAKLDDNDSATAKLSAQLAELEAKIEKLSKPETHERKMRFDDKADKENIDLVNLAIAKRIFEHRIHRGIDLAMPREIEAQLPDTEIVGKLTSEERSQTCSQTCCYGGHCKIRS